MIIQILQRGIFFANFFEQLLHSAISRESIKWVNETLKKNSRNFLALTEFLQLSSEDSGSILFADETTRDFLSLPFLMSELTAGVLIVRARRYFQGVLTHGKVV
ncbi:hypothetical protein DRJ16_07890 [Candidatus Woesearchaeota archaeon]|nr:MAG: hypothetical protein DRJ16_07890 [Candidatus Woesearchaeota archaeon]